MRRLIVGFVGALVAVLCMAQGAKRARVIDGEEVRVDRPFQAEPAVSVEGLRFYDCVLSRNGARCTVIVGTVTSHLAHADYVITLEFDLLAFKPTDHHPGERGVIRKVIDRPKPGQATKFVLLGPPWRSDDERVRPHYLLQTSIRLWKPPK